MGLMRVATPRTAGSLLTAIVLALVPGVAQAQLSLYGWGSDAPTFDYGGVTAGFDYGGGSALGYGVGGFSYPPGGFDFGVSGWDYGLGSSDNGWVGYDSPYSGSGAGFGLLGPSNSAPFSDAFVGLGSIASDQREEGNNSRQTGQRGASRRAKSRTPRKQPSK